MVSDLDLGGVSAVPPPAAAVASIFIRASSADGSYRGAERGLLSDERSVAAPMLRLLRGVRVRCEFIGDLERFDMLPSRARRSLRIASVVFRSTPTSEPMAPVNPQTQPPASERERLGVETGNDGGTPLAQGTPS